MYGYKQIMAPKEYPGEKYKNGFALEHHIVWWQNTGVSIKPGQVIHHKNRKRSDNRFSNLQLMTIEEHARYHSKKVENISLICPVCSKKFEKRPNKVRYAKKMGTSITCSRQCAGAFTAKKYR